MIGAKETGIGDLSLSFGTGLGSKGCIICNRMAVQLRHIISFSTTSSVEGLIVLTKSASCEIVG